MSTLKGTLIKPENSEVRGTITNRRSSDERTAKTLILGPTDVIPVNRLAQLDDIVLDTDFGDGAIVVYNAELEKFVLTTKLENPNTTIICGKY